MSQQQQTKIKRLDLTEWDSLRGEIDERYKNNVLGGEPTYAKVAKDIPNNNPVTVMQWFALIAFFIVVMFAAYKVLPAAIQYAGTFYGTDTVGYQFFELATIAVFMMLNTVGFIYVKLQTEDPSIRKKMAEHPLKANIGDILRKGWRVEVWSPRLFHIMVYVILIWQMAIAVRGIHDYSDIVQWLNALLPVIFEIGSATLVSDLLHKLQTRRYEVNSTLVELKKAFDRQYEKRENDPRYSAIVFQMLRERLASKRSNRILHTAPGEAVLDLVTQEYNRLNAGMDFAKRQVDRRKEIAELHAQIDSQREEVERVESELVDGGATARIVDGKRLPPEGREWTVDTLRADFIARTDVNPDTHYTQVNVDTEYGGNRARKSFNHGARRYFNRYN